MRQLGLAILLSAGLQAMAAEIAFRAKQYAIAISGTIEPGDTERFATVLVRQPHVVSVSVSSPGGSIDEAIRISQIIKLLHLSVRVEDARSCASACFLLYLAGSGRSASPSELMSAQAMSGVLDAQRRAGIKPRMLAGFVGIHRPYERQIDSLQNSQVEIMRRFRLHLESQLVPGRLIDLMMSRPSNDIYWLNEQDLSELGDYAPEHEELFIRKCGYVRNVESRLTSDAVRNDRLIAAQDRAMRCISGLTVAASQEGRSKLKAGWLPPKRAF